VFADADAAALLVCPHDSSPEQALSAPPPQPLICTQEQEVQEVSDKLADATGALELCVPV